MALHGIAVGFLREGRWLSWGGGGNEGAGVRKPVVLVETCVEDLGVLDLRERVEQLVAQIRKWNHMGAPT